MVASHCLLIVGVDLKLQLTFEAESMSHKFTPYTNPLPIRRNKNSSNERVEQADEAAGLIAHSCNPSLGVRLIRDKLAEHQW